MAHVHDGPAHGPDDGRQALITIRVWTSPVIKGQPVYATAAGVVTQAGRQGAYGNLIVIDHGFGLQTRYGHLSGFQVHEGDRVQRGDLIGRLGATGRATGTHLHYEVLANGRLLNPLRLLTAEASRSVTPRVSVVSLPIAEPLATIGRYSFVVSSPHSHDWSTAREGHRHQNEREIKRLRPRVVEINALEPAIQSLTDEQLRAKTVEFRASRQAEPPRRHPQHEVFAVVREAGRRVLNMRHFDVQLIGGMVLHNGTIAEMKTGEGKTLVATLPAYLNALEGKGVHVVTVNDYLARRDSEWMGRLYRFLGMSVGVIQHDLKDDQRQIAYGLGHHATARTTSSASTTSATT